MSHLSHKEVCGPVIGVDVSEYIPLEDKPINLFDEEDEKFKASFKASFGVSLDGLLATLGMPSLEQMVVETISNPDNYSMVVRAITFKGKNRTFKNKVSRKRVLHKSRELNEFKIMINSLANFG